MPADQNPGSAHGADCAGEIAPFLKEAPIFLQPWWLEAVAPGQWRYLKVMRGNELAAVMPVVEKVRMRWRIISMPPLTPWLGPWLRPSTAKRAKREGEYKDLVGGLIDQLPKFAVFHQTMHPGVHNWLPFYWRGYRQTTHYTYILEDTRDLDALWGGLLENIRTDIRKAQKSLKVVESEDYDDVIAAQNQTLERQGKKIPHSREALHRMWKACSERGASRILKAVDGAGRMHSCYHLLYDRATVYLYTGGSDPALRNSGAASLVVWEAIKFASETGRRFDFEGSINEPVERFFRAFGGRLTPYHSISKVNSRLPFLAMTLIGQIRKVVEKRP